MSMAASAVAACKARSVSAPTAPQTRRARRVRRPAALPPICPTRPAFTLLEVVLVLVIIGVFAAMAVPRYAGALARYRSENAARRIAADLRYARALARQTSGSQAVAFNPSADCYTLTGREDPDRPGQPYTVALRAGPYHADLTTAMFGKGPTVTFNGFGVPDWGGNARVQVGDYAYLVTVDSQSGKVSIQAAGGY